MVQRAAAGNMERIKRATRSPRRAVSRRSDTGIAVKGSIISNNVGRKWDKSADNHQDIFEWVVYDKRRALPEFVVHFDM